MDDLLALQALPELEDLGIGPLHWIDDPEDCTVCTSTCSGSKCSVSLATNL
jgi:hypothetical protein